MRRATRGYTLIELIIVCSIILTGLTAGFPQLRTLISEEQLKSTANTLLASALLARSEAIKRQQTVLVSARGASWSNGWIVFADIDNDTVFDNSEPLLYSTPSLPAGIHLSGNKPVAHFLRYRPNGQSKLPGGAFQAGTLKLCHTATEAVQRELILSATGRLRIKRTTISVCTP